MNKIGFQNFRRFTDFVPLELGGITFLVGRNNAGKSTLVKALLLINDFLKSKHVESFSFGNNVLEDANIVTYQRAKNYFAKDNFIKFNYQIENYIIEIMISGQDDKTIADVYHFSIKDLDEGFEFLFEPKKTEISIKKVFQPLDLDVSDADVVANLNNEIDQLQKTINESKLKKSSKEYIELVDQLNKLNQKMEELSDFNLFDDSVNLDLMKEPEMIYNSNGEYTISTELTEDLNWIENFYELISESTYYYEKSFNQIQNGESTPDDFQDYRNFYHDKKRIEESFKDFIKLIEQSSIVYLGANSAKQSALFAIRDKKNALAQAIHEFKQLGIPEGAEAYRFVLNWMQVFEIGDSFKIKMHAGEAYEVTVTSHNVNIPLADKGMGSIQAMLLILRLACIIHKSNTTTQKITVIIEEPELNLHPALQSTLAEMFLLVNYDYNIKVIVETHSEYILRKSQVLVARNEFEVPPNTNPFRVYYFPKDIEQQPYRLEYLEDGTFAKNFGPGFFDTASLSTLELIKMQRQKKSS